MPQLALFDEQPVDAIVGREPSWIVRSGIGLISFVFVTIMLMTWFIRYPDTIHSQIVITTLRPPTEIISKVDGKIHQLYVANNEKVEIGQPLLLIESTVDYQQLQLLEQQLLILSSYLTSSVFSKLDDLSIGHFQMGELQPSLNQLLNAINILQVENNSAELPMRISNAEIMSEQYQMLQQQVANKQATWEKKLALEKNILQKKVALSAKGVISDVELLPLKNGLLDKQLALDDINIQSNLYEIKLKELQQSLNMYRMQRDDKIKQSIDSVANQLIILNNEIAIWKKNYFIQSPIDGEVSFSQFWSANQNVRSGEGLLTLVSSNKELIGKIQLTRLGAGKIKIGQRVDIELLSFPSIEYGQLEGTIKSISLVPGEEGYLVDVSMPSELLTTYSKSLPFSPNLIGNAKIIVDDKRLFERLLEKIIFTLS